MPAGRQAKKAQPPERTAHDRPQHDGRHRDARSDDLAVPGAGEQEAPGGAGRGHVALRELRERHPESPTQVLGLPHQPLLTISALWRRRSAGQLRTCGSPQWPVLRIRAGPSDESRAGNDLNSALAEALSGICAEDETWWPSSRICCGSRQSQPHWRKVKRLLLKSWESRDGPRSCDWAAALLRLAGGSNTDSAITRSSPVRVELP